MLHAIVVKRHAAWCSICKSIKNISMLRTAPLTSPRAKLNDTPAPMDQEEGPTDLSMASVPHQSLFASEQQQQQQVAQHHSSPPHILSHAAMESPVHHLEAYQVLKAEAAAAQDLSQAQDLTQARQSIVKSEEYLEVGTYD